jgi:hypothetical protein
LQGQLKSDAFETYENNMTLEDAFTSHAPRDTGHDSGERILDAGDGPDQTVTVAMLATRFVENVKVRLQSPATLRLIPIICAPTSRNC